MFVAAILWLHSQALTFYECRERLRIPCRDGRQHEAERWYRNGMHARSKPGVHGPVSGLGKDRGKADAVALRGALEDGHKARRHTQRVTARTLDESGFDRSSTLRLCAGASRPAAGASSASPSFRFGADGLNTIAVRFGRSGGASSAAAAP